MGGKWGIDRLNRAKGLANPKKCGKISITNSCTAVFGSLAAGAACRPERMKEKEDAYEEMDGGSDVRADLPAFPGRLPQV